MRAITWLYNREDEHRKVGWLELFYDLVFVATLIELGNLLSSDVSVEGFIRFSLLFVAIWWSWTGMTFFANRFLIDDVPHRLLVFTQIFSITIMAISIQGAFDNLTGQFVLGYVINRTILIILYIRAWINVPETRPLLNGYIITFSIGALLWLISAFVSPPLTHILWALGILIEFTALFLPYMARWQMNFAPHIEHMVERYGIFSIIVLGESFLKVIDNFAGTPFGSDLFLTGVFISAIACSLWWLYFDDISESEINEGARSLYIWIFFHLPLALGITAYGVSAKKILEQTTGDPLADKYRLLVTTAVVIYLIAIAIIDEVTKHPEKSNKSSAVWRIGSAILITGIGLFAGSLTSTVFIGLVALIFVVQVAVDVNTERNFQRQTQLQAPGHAEAAD